MQVKRTILLSLLLTACINQAPPTPDASINVCPGLPTKQLIRHCMYVCDPDGLGHTPGPATCPHARVGECVDDCIFPTNPDEPDQSGYCP